ncbi:MAG: hypothetical protein PVJ29_15845 [Desulfobacterales bacterium]
MIISIESIIEMLNKNNDPNNCIYRDQCLNCGCEVEIKIAKTSGGYGLKGGVLYEQNPKGVWALCDDCFVKSGGSETSKKGSFTDAA